MENKVELYMTPRVSSGIIIATCLLGKHKQADIHEFLSIVVSTSSSIYSMFPQMYSSI